MDVITKLTEIPQNRELIKKLAEVYVEHDRTCTSKKNNLAKKMKVCSATIHNKINEMWKSGEVKRKEPKVEVATKEESTVKTTSVVSTHGKVLGKFNRKTVRGVIYEGDQLLIVGY